jgi:FkbM family methyltransferase
MSSFRPFMMGISNEIEQYRYETLWSKEPETIVWIKIFKEKAIFFDVGANIGLYSLFCASKYPDMQIHAFEPGTANYKALLNNIESNGYQNITPHKLAVSDRPDIWGNFYEISDDSGASGGQFGAKLEGTAYASSHLVRTTTIDCMAAEVGLPAYIKIDIDGQEFEVVKGMSRTMQSDKLRSVLIEIDQSDPSKVSQIMLAFLNAGFSVQNGFNQMRPHSTTRREREGIDVRNVVFTR